MSILIIETEDLIFSGIVTEIISNIPQLKLEDIEHLKANNVKILKYFITKGLDKQRRK